MALWVIVEIKARCFTAGCQVEKMRMIYFDEDDEVNQDQRVLGLGFMTPLKKSVFII